MSSNPFNSRDELVAEIKKAGQYIVDHADNLLGEYPSLMNDFSLTVKLCKAGYTVIHLDRSHLVVDENEYINHIMSFDD